MDKGKEERKKMREENRKQEENGRTKGIRNKI